MFRFRRFQQSQINPEHTGIDYYPTCAALDMDPHGRMLDDVSIPLKPQQVSGLAWMIRQEDGRLEAQPEPQSFKSYDRE